MQRDLLVAIAEAIKADLTGVFTGTAIPKDRARASPAGGRWGPDGTYSVLYLGRPPETIIVEAYRHLVDDDEDLTGEMVGPRLFSTVEVNVTNILDLRTPRPRNSSGSIMPRSTLISTSTPPAAASDRPPTSSASMA